MAFTVLLYHEIRESGMLQEGKPSPIEVKQDYDDNLPAPLFVTLERFSAQMAYLAENNYHTLTLSEIIRHYYENIPLPDQSVLLTFDDCYQSIGLYAYPILKQYQFHATMFVVTGWLNTQQKHFTPERSVCMTEDALRQMSDVFEYANHSHSFHTRLNETTSKMMTASDEAIVADLKQCSDHPIIQAKDVFAYPFGLFAPQNVTLLRQEGFRLAFTCAPGKNDSETDPLLLKRNVVPTFMELGTFRRLLN